MSINERGQISVALKRITKKLELSGITIGPPVSEKKIQKFEEFCNATLPESYRRFISEVGSVCTMFGGFELNAIGENIELEDLSKPFMLSKEWMWEYDTTASPEQIELFAYNGTIELVDIGCAQTFNLIVTGKCRGEVWHFCEMGVQPCCERQDFLGWFEKWLDDGDVVDYFSDYNNQN